MACIHKCIRKYSDLSSIWISGQFFLEKKEFYRGKGFFPNYVFFVRDRMRTASDESRQL